MLHVVIAFAILCYMYTHVCVCCVCAYQNRLRPLLRPCFNKGLLGWINASSLTFLRRDLALKAEVLNKPWLVVSGGKGNVLEAMHLHHCRRTAAASKSELRAQLHCAKDSMNDVRCLKGPASSGRCRGYRPGRNPPVMPASCTVDSRAR